MRWWGLLLNFMQCSGLDFGNMNTCLLFAGLIIYTNLQGKSCIHSVTASNIFSDMTIERKWTSEEHRQQTWGWWQLWLPPPEHRRCVSVYKKSQVFRAFSLFQCFFGCSLMSIFQAALKLVLGQLAGYPLLLFYRYHSIVSNTLNKFKIF